MDKDVLNKLFDFFPSIVVFSTLCYIVNQCARVHKDTISNIGQFGDSNNLKFLMTTKSIFNFYVVAGIAFTILSSYLKFFSNDLFLAIFIPELIGLGVKLSLDLRPPSQ